MNTYARPNPVTSHDIAKRAGVSQSTVSRVLSGNARVAKDACERVQAAVRELNYRPNGAARTMRTSQTGNIGVVVSRLGNPLYPEMLQILGRQLGSAGRRMVVWSAEEMDEKAAIDAIRESQVDGAIMTTATAESTGLYEALQLNVPVVLINRVVEGWKCDQVTSDNADGGRVVAEYFVRAGKRRIGLIGGSDVASTIRDRQSGFRAALGKAGMPLAETLCRQVDVFSYKSGFEAASRLLELSQPPDAIFCVNDVIALGARDAARARGIEVPASLWIVGYDDIEMASWYAYDLTTIRQPLVRMTETAVGLLMNRIRGQGGKWNTVCLPNELVIRSSTGRHA
ncbi:MAG: LacI family DNA-binding transcriptional regulator [Noviherbaspirillum sp.]